MIKLIDINKSFGGQDLFKDLSFDINSREKIGLIGRNGYGKTTLLQMILGRIDPDSGSIFIPKNYHIGYLEQHIRFTEDSVLKEGSKGLHSNEQYESWKVEKILHGLGFSKEDMNKHPSTFSGGYQIRLNLAKVLVSKPDMLLLDEPNNYLDIVAIRWLIGFLKEWKGELILITHDRNFMDSVVTHTVCIHRQKAKKIQGTTEKMYAQIALEEEIYEKTRINEEKQRKQTEIFIRRFRAKARLGGMVQSRIKSLEKQERKEALSKLENLEFSFNSKNFPGSQMMSIYNISFSYDGKEPYLIDKFSLSIGNRERIAVIGRNGKGKSTLLKILADEISPVSGNIKEHPELTKGYFGQSNVSRLSDNKTVVEEIMSSSPDCSIQLARNICGSLMFQGDLALKGISVLSGGEKSRVLLGKLLVTPCHLLMLDEPTNHLDLESCESLLEAIDSFDGSILMVTHNEMYLHRFAERLIVFDNDKIRLFEGTYSDFLKDIGWDDEEEFHGEDTSKKEVLKNTFSEKKELKKKRANLIQEKSKTLKPLENEVKHIESKIINLEKELNDNTNLLIKASHENDVGKLTDLAKRNKIIQPEINELFSRLELLTRTFEEENKRYEALLNDLEKN